MGGWPTSQFSLVYSQRLVCTVHLLSPHRHIPLLWAKGASAHQFFPLPSLQWRMCVSLLEQSFGQGFPRSIWIKWTTSRNKSWSAMLAPAPAGSRSLNKSKRDLISIANIIARHVLLLTVLTLALTLTATPKGRWVPPPGQSIPSCRRPFSILGHQFNKPKRSSMSWAWCGPVKKLHKR